MEFWETMPKRLENVIAVDNNFLHCLQDRTWINRVEVKVGEPLQCYPGENYLVHVSQACLGEKKKDKGIEPVYIYATMDNKKFLIGTLSHDKFPQSVFDLVFEKQFELSHTGKNASVHFTGYKVLQQDETDDSEPEDGSEEDAPVAADTEKPAAQASLVKKADAKGKAIDNKDSDDSDESDDMPLTNGEDEDDDESSDEDDTSDEDEEDEDGDEEETPKKVELAGKKRAADSATKTPAPDKKAKFVSPQKTDGKKVSGHVATPYPTKKSEKKPSTSSDQKKDATPKGSVTCTTCSRSFGTEKALESHSKAKHGSA